MQGRVNYDLGTFYTYFAVVQNV